MDRILDSFTNKVRQIVSEEVHRILSEDKQVTFGRGITNPNYGWCVIMAGAAGSGKGFTIKNQIPIVGKTINVDDLKKLYIKMVNKGQIQDRVYDLSNAQDTYQLHKVIKNKGWKQKQMNGVMNSDTHPIDRLPNLIFDITGKQLTDISSIIEMAKPIGYKIVLVWVATNRGMAMFRNLKRDRVVPQETFHTIHNQCNAFLPSFLKGNESDIVNDIDKAYIVFGSGFDVQSNVYSDSPCFQLIKTSNGFKFPKRVERDLMMVLGKPEPNPNELEYYQSNDDAKSQMQSYEVIGKDGKPETKWKTSARDFYKNTRH